MNAIRPALFAVAMSLAAAAFAPAKAMTVADVSGLGAESAAARTAFVIGGDLVPGRPSRLDRVDAEVASAAAEAYFDFDAMITFGALALAGGALAALGAAGFRKNSERSLQTKEPAWRAQVMRALQADLADFTQRQRRAA